jgi:hypothetical protein
MSIPECESTRYTDGPCIAPHPCCYRHGIAEQARHCAAAGIARCEVEEVKN